MSQKLQYCDLHYNLCLHAHCEENRVRFQMYYAQNSYCTWILCSKFLLHLNILYKVPVPPYKYISVVIKWTMIPFHVFFYIRKSVLTSALLSKECVFRVLQAQSPESPKLEVAWKSPPWGQVQASREGGDQQSYPVITPINKNDQSDTVTLRVQ